MLADATVGCVQVVPFSTHITANGMTTIIATDSQDASMIGKRESATGQLMISTSNVSATSMIIGRL